MRRAGGGCSRHGMESAPRSLRGSRPRPLADAPGPEPQLSVCPCAVPGVSAAREASWLLRAQGENGGGGVSAPALSPLPSGAAPGSRQLRAPCYRHQSGIGSEKKKHSSLILRLRAHGGRQSANVPPVTLLLVRHRKY